MYESEWGDVSDDEYPDEWDDVDDDFDDGGVDDGAELISCPHCGAEIYEDSEQCAICGEYVTHASTNLAWFWRATAMILLGCLAYYLWRMIMSVS